MSNEITTLLKGLSQTRSSKAKLELLKKHKDNANLRRLVNYALNPYINFGVRDFAFENADKIDTDEALIDDVFTLLDKLHKREYTGNHAKDKLKEFADTHNYRLCYLLWTCLQKDLNCGVSFATIDKVFPDLIPQWNIAKAQPFEGQIDYPILAEEK